MRVLCGCLPACLQCTRSCIYRNTLVCFFSGILCMRMVCCRHGFLWKKKRARVVTIEPQGDGLRVQTEYCTILAKCAKSRCLQDTTFKCNNHTTFSVPDLHPSLVVQDADQRVRRQQRARDSECRCHEM